MPDRRLVDGRGAPNSGPLHANSPDGAAARLFRILEGNHRKAYEILKKDKQEAIKDLRF